MDEIEPSDERSAVVDFSPIYPPSTPDSSSDYEFDSDTESDINMQDTDCIYINDPVHGMLEIHPLCKAVIDTPEFQRLRFIKQCGISCFVYPGAIHTRFDHSLGVCFLAQRVLRKLQEIYNDKEKFISKEESICVQLAGLCHDLGHGPFSHTWERYINEYSRKEQNKSKFEHEQMSVKIFDYLIEKNNLEDEFNKYGITVEYRKFIKDLILGGKDENKYEGFTPKSFLFEIVANKQNGLDVDKYEYLLRDPYFFGTKINADFERYLVCLRIDKGLDDKEHICYLGKLRSHIINIFKQRAEMHNIAYQHRVCLKIETMLIDAFNQIGKEFKIIGYENSKQKSYHLWECHKNEEAYLQLTDRIFENILYSNDQSLSEAKKIILRILNRKEHYAEMYVHDLKNDIDIESFEEKLEEVIKKLNDSYAKDNAEFRRCFKKLQLTQPGLDSNLLKNVVFINNKNEGDKRIKKYPELWLPEQKICTKLYIFCTKKGTKEMKKKVSDLVKNKLNDYLD